MKRKLSTKEAASYLANVLYTSLADGGISSTEDYLLKDIVRNIGAEQEDLKRAQEMIDSPDFKLRLLLAPDARMSNLEDMILVALSDDNLSKDEAKPIEKLAKALHYSQTDLNMAVRRAKGRLQRLRGSGMKPPPLPDTNQVQPPPPPPRPKKPEKKSQKPKQVIPPAPKPEKKPPRKTAKRKPEKKAQVKTAKRAPEPAPEPPQKTEAPPAAEKPLKQAFNSLQACIRAHDNSDNPNEYCFGYGSDSLNIWGCRLMHMDWAPGSELLTTGKYRDGMTFVFDKKALVDKVTSAFRTCKDCPYVNIDYIEAAFDHIPSRANMISRWKHHPARDGQRIQTRQSLHGCVIQKEMYSDGVSPIGNAGALNIIKRAAKKVSTKKPDFKLLEK